MPSNIHAGWEQSPGLLGYKTRSSAVQEAHVKWIPWTRQDVLFACMAGIILDIAGGLLLPLVERLPCRDKSTEICHVLQRYTFAGFGGVSPKPQPLRVVHPAPIAAHQSNSPLQESRRQYRLQGYHGLMPHEGHQRRHLRRSIPPRRSPIALLTAKTVKRCPEISHIRYALESLATLYFLCTPISTSSSPLLRTTLARRIRRYIHLIVNLGCCPNKRCALSWTTTLSCWFEWKRSHASCTVLAADPGRDHMAKLFSRCCVHCQNNITNVGKVTMSPASAEKMSEDGESYSGHEEMPQAEGTDLNPQIFDGANILK